MDGPEVETTLVDLRAASLQQVRQHVRPNDVELLLSQIERPRVNIGNTGPPGRAD
jgi:hypothetical protein